VAIAFSAIVVLTVAFLFLGATEKAYSCSSLLTPAPAASVVPGESPQLGQAQPDMGRTHIAVGTAQRYISCPPASGNHYNAANVGPIPARFYAPEDGTIPEGWIHNLEHGALVVLYSCANGCPDAATMQKLKDFAGPTFPNSPVCNEPVGFIGPVVARFDDMSTKFAGLVWDRVLLQDSLNTDQLLAFFKAEGERFNPEAQCTPASPSPSAPPVVPSGSPATAPPASASPASASPAPSASTSPAPSASPS
jgi:Protein of unknown function (DUF3105)